MLWADKYAPKKLDQVIGHGNTIEEIHKWMKNWTVESKPLLLHGPAGSGKTSMAYALASEYGFELLEMNASDVRNRDAVERYARLASESLTLFGKRRLILFDEVDGMYAQDRGGTSAIADIIKTAKCPIVLTANDLWDQKLSGLRTACEPANVKKVHYATITKILESICEKESIACGREVLLEIARNSSGDVRSAINDLQALADGRSELTKADIEIQGGKDRKDNIFNAITTVLKTKDAKKSKQAFDSVEEDPDMFLKWIEENVYREYKKPEELNAAYDKISRADVFMGRIKRRQDWGLQKYSIDLMTSGVSLSKKETYSGWGRYAFPSLIKYLSVTKGERGQRKATATKIAALTHVSVNTAIKDYLPMYTELIQDNDLAPMVTAQFDFDEDDLKLLGLSQRKKTLERAAELKQEYFEKKYVEEIAEVKPEKAGHKKPPKEQTGLAQFM